MFVPSLVYEFLPSTYFLDDTLDNRADGVTGEERVARHNEGKTLHAEEERRLAHVAATRCAIHAIHRLELVMRAGNFWCGVTACSVEGSSDKRALCLCETRPCTRRRNAGWPMSQPPGICDLCDL